MNNGHLRDLVNVLKLILFLLSCSLFFSLPSLLFRTLEANIEVGKLDHTGRRAGVCV